MQTAIYNVEKELDKLAHQLESQHQLIHQYETDLGRYPLKVASISDELIEVEHSLALLNEKEQQSYKQLRRRAKKLFSEAQSHFSSSERQLQEANLSENKKQKQDGKKKQNSLLFICRRKLSLLQWNRQYVNRSNRKLRNLRIKERNVPQT
nr:hypothetical protein [Bacillus pumilus]